MCYSDSRKQVYEKLVEEDKTFEEAYERFSNKLRRMGIDEELEKMGIQDGDTVKIFDFEFEWTR